MVVECQRGSGPKIKHFRSSSSEPLAGLFHMRLRASLRHTNTLAHTRTHAHTSQSLSICVRISIPVTPAPALPLPASLTHSSGWPTGGSATAGGTAIRVNTTILLCHHARLRSKAGLESSLNNWTADCSRSQKNKRKKNGRGPWDK